MSPMEVKLIEAWQEFKQYAESQMGYMNPQTMNERLNGAGAFVDYLRGVQPKMGTSYATAPRWPTA